MVAVIDFMPCYHVCCDIVMLPGALHRRACASPCRWHGMRWTVGAWLLAYFTLVGLCKPGCAAGEGAWDICRSPTQGQEIGMRHPCMLVSNAPSSVPRPPDDSIGVLRRARRRPRSQPNICPGAVLEELAVLLVSASDSVVSRETKKNAEASPQPSQTQKVGCEDPFKKGCLIFFGFADRYSGKEGKFRQSATKLVINYRRQTGFLSESAFGGLFGRIGACLESPAAPEFPGVPFPCHLRLSDIPLIMSLHVYFVVRRLFWGQRSAERAWSSAHLVAAAWTLMRSPRLLRPGFRRVFRIFAPG